MIAQKLGLPLSEIAQHMADLPTHKAPSKSDWGRVSEAMRADLDARIHALERLRDRLDGCIGCGCLSLRKCKPPSPHTPLPSQVSF